MKFFEATVTIGVIFLIIAIGLFFWQIKRKINYNCSYKSMVEQTVKDMVKQECLK